MTLLSKLERLEKLAGAWEKSDASEVDPELLASARRLLAEATERAARPKPPIHEQIVELRAELSERIKNNETRDPADEQQARAMFGDNWNWLTEWLIDEQTRRLAKLEALAATMS